MKHDRVEGLPIALASTRKALARFFGETSLDTTSAFIDADQKIGRLKLKIDPALPTLYRDRSLRRCYDRTEKLVFHGSTRHDGNVLGTAMHIPAELVVVKPMWVAEMRIIHAESERLLVHRIDECVIAILGHLIFRNALILLQFFQDLRPKRFSQGLACIIA